MSELINIDRLALETARLFVGDEEVYSVAEDFPRPHPRRYAAYVVATAVNDVMHCANLDQNDRDLRDHIVEAAQHLMTGYEFIEKQRIAVAKILNNYSAQGPFNPN